MDQEIEAANYSDENGNPTGGHVRGVGIVIDWQNGPLGRGKDRIPPNGAFLEGVLNAAIQRLEYFQKSKYSCRENAIALTKLQEAKHWLDHRTRAREAQKVEGLHEVHS